MELTISNGPPRVFLIPLVHFIVIAASLSNDFNCRARHMRTHSSVPVHVNCLFGSRSVAAERELAISAPGQSSEYKFHDFQLSRDSDRFIAIHRVALYWESEKCSRPLRRCRWRSALKSFSRETANERRRRRRHTIFSTDRRNQRRNESPKNDEIKRDFCAHKRQ